MSETQAVRIGDRLIGPGRPVFILAEIGYNFNTLEEAKATIDAAVGCGVDAVKFQTFRAETLTSRKLDFPDEAGGTDQFEEFRKYELSEEHHRELFSHAREKGILAFSTPSYFDDVELLERCGVPAYKIGSDDLTNLPFIRYVARKGKPVIFSTGMGTLQEVEEAVRAIRQAGNDRMVILHCVSNYPIRDLKAVNLRAIPALQAAFSAPVGFSDHTTTLSAALGAVAFGACLIERHFTLDKSIQAPDAFFSADPAQMSDLVGSIRELEQALGDGFKRPAPSEEQMRLKTRKSAIARTDIRPGEPITPEKIIVKRPATGISPKEAHRLVGRRAKRLIPQDEAITLESLE